MRAAPNMPLCLSAFRSKRKTEEALVLLLIKFVTGNVCVCLVRMSACFVPLWNFRRIHSPGALKLEEAEVMERQRIAVPVGREFLCRRDILGVPGVLDGLSHVVSDVQKERGEGKTMALEESCYSDILVTALHLFVGNDKKK